MKKQIIIITASLLLSGCQLFNSSTNTTGQEANLSPIESSESTTLSSQESITSNEPSTDLLTPQRSLLDEKIIGDSDYPLITLPDEVPEDINLAISEYFNTKLTEEEQANNYQQVPLSSLKKIKDFIHLDEDLAQLNVATEQVSLKMGQDLIYVPRIIVPMTYSEAEKVAEDNDTRLLNLALTELGNRLVLLAYYHEEADELLPRHLINSSHSLFYFEAPSN